MCIGLAAAALCYLAVALKNRLGYDDSLDAFGVHGVGGFVGAVSLDAGPPPTTIFAADPRSASSCSGGATR